ncbi:MAG TPA: DUF3014 domain-containing protein [Myxococcota bacterium]|nr:DUF3014 domain-containing protein [Myxococcota bacterium]HRY96918.1 DUF3014 domain-containing protein [Myxococcota bacterium]HSA22039.1 DUF3014 domain-containing protein [Myxococcota bacterium]
MADTHSGKWVVLVIGLLAGAGAVGSYFYFSGRGGEAAPPPDGGTPVAAADAGPAPAPAEAPPEEEIAPATAVAPTDEELRALLGRLSKDASFWLENEGILDRLVATIEAVARGESPRKLVPFLAPEGRFLVLERDGRLFLDPACYARYDPIALSFVSLDTAAVAEQYRTLGRWLRRSQRALGVPGRTLRQALVESFSELLAVPVFTGDVPLSGTSVNLKMDIPALEGLSEAQKHLFRMGPANVLRVQAKLRELGAALGIGRELAAVKPLEIPLPPADTNPAAPAQP